MNFSLGAVADSDVSLLGAMTEGEFLNAVDSAASQEKAKLFRRMKGALGLSADASVSGDSSGYYRLRFAPALAGAACWPPFRIRQPFGGSNSIWLSISQSIASCSPFCASIKSAP